MDAAAPASRGAASGRPENGACVTLGKSEVARMGCNNIFQK